MVSSILSQHDKVSECISVIEGLLFSQPRLYGEKIEDVVSRLKFHKKIVEEEIYGSMEFVDLGLPSGTLWSDRWLGADSIDGEGVRMDYYESNNGFWNCPTWFQLKELADNCEFRKIEGGDWFGLCGSGRSVECVGKNGNSIRFYANDYYNSRLKLSSDLFYSKSVKVGGFGGTMKFVDYANNILSDKARDECGDKMRVFVCGYGLDYYCECFDGNESIKAFVRPVLSKK